MLRIALRVRLRATPFAQDDTRGTPPEKQQKALMKIIFHKCLCIIFTVCLAQKRSDQLFDDLLHSLQLLLHIRNQCKLISCTVKVVIFTVNTEVHVPL